MSNLQSNKVSVIGAGNVGASIVNALVLLEVSREVVLFNRTLDKAEGQAWDISDVVPLVGECTITPTNSYDDLIGSDIVIVTVGAKQKPNQTRLALLNENSKIISNIMKQLDEVTPNAVIILVSNPVDIITRIAIENSKRDKNLIFGSGTILDTARLKDYLGKILNINRKNIHTHIIGEHGDSEFALWSHALVGSIPIEKYPMPSGINYELLQQKACKATKQRAYQIIQRKGATSFGIGVSMAKLVKSVLRDERKILSVSTLADKKYNLPKGSVLSLPAIIGKKGVAEYIHLDMTSNESEQLLASAKSLDEAYLQIQS